MDFCIIIPAHNEEKFIGATLESLVQQTLKPRQLIVVNDNSTDATQNIVNTYCQNYEFITIVNNSSSEKHLPGTKIINAFYKGFNALDHRFEVICKFDADLIFPIDYLERLSEHFENDPKLGMAAGFCYIEKEGEWILENLTRKDHIRGALKAYRKSCFEQIDGLRKSMGWDTVDELIAKYYGYNILTDPDLKVKHLKPTGKSYNKSSKYLQGEAMYRMRSGVIITLITAIKMTIKRKSFAVLQGYIGGYYNAKNNNAEFLVTEDQGKFIRSLRWKGILDKLS